MSFLLDTNVLSELVRKAPAASVVRRLRDARQAELSTSAICVTELRYGAARHPAGRALWERLSREVLSLVTVLPVSTPVAIRAGDLLADLERRGAGIGVEDVLIAATALTHGLTVVTRNIRHLACVRGLAVQSWWE